MVESLAADLKQGESQVEPDKLQKLGIMLFRALFQGPILQTFQELYNDIQLDSRARLRLELYFLPEAKAESKLPWEFLCIPPEVQTSGMEPWLAASDKIVLVRLVSADKKMVRQVLNRGEKIRILVAVAAPEKWADQIENFGPNGEVLEINRLGVIEHEEIRRTLPSMPQFEIEILNPTTLTSLKDKLREFKPHVLHFIGHGDVLKVGKEDCPVLIFVDDNAINSRWALPVTAKDFAELFESHVPGVVLLQSCKTGQDGDQQGYSSVAARVGTAGIPLVIAMQYEISNVTATEFAIILYECLLKKNDFESAVQIGRKHLFNKEKNRDFGTPQIYTSQKEGYIFDVPIPKSVPVLLIALEHDKKNINLKDPRQHTYYMTIRDGRDKKNFMLRKLVNRKELLSNIWKAIRALRSEMPEGENSTMFEDSLWIEFFLSNPDLCSSYFKVDLFYAENPPGDPATEKAPMRLGQRYKVVVRSLYRRDKFDLLHPKWSAKWIHEIVSSRSSAKENIAALKEAIAKAQVLGLPFEPQDTLEDKTLITLLDSDIPVAAWVRQGANPENDLKTFLATIPDLRELPERVREERRSSGSQLGQNLVLLWDNPEHRLGQEYEWEAPAMEISDELLEEGF